MKGKIQRTAAICLAAVLLFSVPVKAAPSVSAKSAVLMDAETGRILWEKNADEKSLIASTTKIMTGLIIAEECDLKARVQIPKSAIGVEGSSMYLKEGEILTVEALLYGMMLHSGNDAAAALAMYCAGSPEAFAEKMNRKAQSLQLNRTHFANPHGLDDSGNYSTAKDLGKLAAYAMENPIFHQVVSQKTAVFGKHSLRNHNKLLWQYEGAVGVKTGYTRSAGRILVSCAERSGRRLIAVTIHAPNDWADHKQMLDYGFKSYEMQPLLQMGQEMGTVPVIGGGEPLAYAITREDFSYPLTEGEQVAFCLDLPVFIFAPVLAGEQAGAVTVLVDGREAASIPLFWKYSVLEEA